MGVGGWGVSRTAKPSRGWVLLSFCYCGRQPSLGQEKGKEPLLHILAFRVYPESNLIYTQAGTYTC